MAVHLIPAFLLIAKTAAAAEACSEPLPLSLPITDVELSNGHTIRGIPMSVGSPPQNISFLTHNFLNNTWVYNTTSPFCISDTTKAQCLTMRGGTYDTSESTTASDGLDVLAAGGDESDTDRALGTHVWHSSWAKDVVNVGNVSLDDFPLGMPGFDVGDIYDTQANIGLGRNSTLLNTLRDTGHISSRTYSYWWGRNSASSSNAMDGQLVLGGYDAAKVTGPNITQTLLPPTPGCVSGMYLTITGMELGFPNGTKADMLAPSILSACIQLDFPALMSPRYDPFVMRFENITDTYRDPETSGLPWEVPSYRLVGQYGGNLTIVLDGSSRYTLSNDILIIPREYVASDGAFKTDSTAPGILMTPTYYENINDVVIIGRPFFSAAYIMVDLDAETWTLWHANATTDTRLVSIGGDCAEKPTVNASPPKIPTPGVVETNATSPNATESATDSASGIGKAQPETSASPGLTAGTIAGIAVGAVFGSGLVAGLIVICWLKRNKRQTRRSASETDIALTKYGHESEQLTPIWHEKPAGPPPELPSLGIYAHELPVSERACEISSGPNDKQPAELPTLYTPKA